MAFARVQGHHGTDTGTSGTFSVAGSAIASGNAVMGLVTVGSPTVADIISVTDNQGNTYTITDKVADGGNNQSAAYFFCLNITNAPTTITLHYTAGLSAVLLLWDEISGLGAGTLNGHHAQVQAAASTTANAVKTGTTFGASGDMIYGATLCDDSVNTISAGTSPLAFTTATNDNADPNFFGVSLFTEFAAAAAASDATFTISASGTMLTGGFAITPAGGGGTTLTLGQQAWHWNGQAPALTFDLALALKQWNWHAQAPALSLQVPLAQKAWHWAGNATLLTSAVALVTRAWNWAGNGIVFAGTTTLVLAQHAWVWAAASIGTGAAHAWRSRRGQPGSTPRGGAGSGGKVGS